MPDPEAEIIGTVLAVLLFFGAFIYAFLRRKFGQVCKACGERSPTGAQACNHCGAKFDS
jgi:predicted amidophosphoribosyltransferase